MGEELDRLGITEEEVTTRYERVVLRQAADILRKRVPSRRSRLGRFLNRTGFLEYELESVIRRLELESERHQ